MAWLAWLGDTAGSIALRESIWVYPLVETAHVLGIALFVGLAALFDLRLIGLVGSSTPVSEFVERIEPWTMAGFVVMVSSGVALFYGDPVRFATNPFFQAKLVLLVLAGLNAGAFHRTVFRRVATWDLQTAPPAGARAAGWISLALWAAIVVLGRWIAFHEVVPS